MAQRNRRFTASDYSNMLETVKEYATGFTKKKGYDANRPEKLSKYQRSKVRKYFDAISEFTKVPNTTYATRDKKKLEKVQRATQGKVLKDLKVAFIPSADKDHVPNVKVEKGFVEIQFKHTKQLFIPLPPSQLARDPEKAIQTAIKNIPASIQKFKIMCGNSVYHGFDSIKGVTEKVHRLMGKYNSIDYDANNPNSQYYGNWLHGLIGFNPNVSDRINEEKIKRFMQEKHAAQEELRKKRNRERKQYRDSLKKSSKGSRPGRG